jgi:signal transduction histidine kinase
MNKIHLEQILQNLISNALRYRSEATPEIVIDAEPVNGRWVIRVSDNGLGIAAADQQKIFEPFTRLRKGDASDGTGLGLAICRRIVQRYGGSIWVESELGKGSTFLFEVPGRPADTPQITCGAG